MSNKDFSKFRVVKNDIYPLAYSFCIVRKSSVEKYMKGQARCQKDGNHIFIYIPEANKTDRGVSAHELFHAVEFTMQHVGQSFGDSPNETWAYLMQWLTEEWERFIK